MVFDNLIEYRVADAYRDWEPLTEPFDRNGRKYVKVRSNCDRCWKGMYITRIENGSPVPHPAYGGVCLKCGGTGYITKDVRAYNEKEYAAYRRGVEQREKAREEKEERRRAEFKRTWNEKHGFNEAGETYIVYGNSYPIKDQLKEQGFKYSPELRWHGPNTVDVPSDCGVQMVKFDQLYGWVNGRVETRFEAKRILDEIFSRTFTNSEWIGQEKERLRALDAIVKEVGEYSNDYSSGYHYVFTVDGNEVVWFTSKFLDVVEGDGVSLTGTVKSHTVFKGSKVTVLNRCVVK